MIWFGPILIAGAILGYLVCRGLVCPALERESYLQGRLDERDCQIDDELALMLDEAGAGY